MAETRSGTRPKGPRTAAGSAAGDGAGVAAAGAIPPPTEAVSSDRAEERHEPEGAPPPICSVAFCPICTAVTMLGDARPELTQHLLLAGREFLLALRSVIDARLEGPPEKPTSGLQRITIE